MEFKRLRIKALSDQALSKLKRGLPARVMAGEGMQIAVMPHQYSAISKAFLKNKGMNMSLSPPEVEANMQIGGEGIFGKKADKFFKKIGAKEAIYKTGSALKPFVMESIDAVASAAATAGVPAPLIALAQKETKGYLDNPDAYQSKKGRKELMGRIKSTAEDVASPYLADAGVDMEQLKDMKKMAKDMKSGSSGPPMTTASMKGKAEEAFLSNLQSQLNKRAPKVVSKSGSDPTNPWDDTDGDGVFGNGIIQDIRKSLKKGVGGMGLYAGASSGRGIGTGLYTGGCMKCQGCECSGEGFKSNLHDVGKKFVNTGRKMVGTGHPATASQALDANFLMSNQYPPSYQRRK